MQWYHSHKCFHKIGQCHMCILKIKRFAYEDSICIFPHICRLEKKRLHPACMGEMHMPNAETICTKWQHMQNIHTHMWLKTAAYATSVFYLYFWSEETLQWLPPPWFNVNTGGAGEGGGSVQGRWGAGEGMVGAGEGRVSTAIWLFAVWLLSQLFWRHFWLRDERPPCSRAWLCDEGMMIAVGTRNMVTNPLSWSSKSAVEPADKNKGFKSRSSLE